MEHGRHVYLTEKGSNLQICVGFRQLYIGMIQKTTTPQTIEKILSDGDFIYISFLRVAATLDKHHILRPGGYLEVQDT